MSATVTTTRDRVALSRFTFEMGDPKHLGHLLTHVRGVEGGYDAYRVTSGPLATKVGQVLSDREYRKQFYPAVDQRQALDDRQSKYYVPIYDRPDLARLDIVREFSDAIEFSSGESVHLLSGFRGSGKTSEMLRLAETVRTSGRPAVYVDIEDYFNTEIPLDMGAFPIALAAGFVYGTGLNDAIRKPLSERFLALLKRMKIEPTLSAAAGGVAADIKLSLREDKRVIAQVTAAVTENRRTFREELHDFFDETSRAVSPDRAPLFIVDSIDHFRGRAERFHEVRSSVERVFSELTDELRLPGLHVIYTVPLYVQSPLGLRHEILNIKVANPDGTPHEPGVAALREVLAARAPNGDAQRLMGGMGDELILRSGGLFRDLLRLTGQLIQTSRALPATSDDFARTEMVIRNDFEGTLSAEKLEILRDIAATSRLTPRNDQWSDAMDLMTSGAILKYPNGERAWFGVHPLLRPLLPA